MRPRSAPARLLRTGSCGAPLPPPVRCAAVGPSAPPPPKSRSKRIFSFLLDQLLEQLFHFLPDRLQRPPPQWRGAILLTQRAPVTLLGGTQVAFSLQAVEQRIKASRRDPVAMARQLLDHAESEHGFVHRMM